MTELPKLTTNIFDAPDCPEWAKWAAVDADGRGFVYRANPVMGRYGWHITKGGFQAGTHIGDYDPTDWQSSLTKRPEAKSENALADKSTPEHDDVSAPAYYVNTPFGLEVRKITEHYDSYLAAALKYIFRNGQKVYDGLTAKESAIKDLRKAIQNIKFEIEKIENS